MKTHLFKIRPLEGTFNAAEKNPLSWHSYADGSYQQSVEDYLSDHFGFRELAIRTYNQYIWSCYGTWNNTCIRLGKDNWLFYLDDVNDFYQGLGCYDSPDSTATMQRYASDSRHIYWLQEILKEYGISLFVCVAPSKSMTFSNNIAEPSGYSCNHPKAYQYYQYRFAELGVNHIDFNAFFAQLKGKTTYPLYYKFSSHWSNIAACYMGDTLLRYMAHLGGKPLPHLHIGKSYNAKVRKPDNDLVDVVNLWFPIEKINYQYADVSMVHDSNATHPRMLSVGDSYCKNLHTMLPFDSIFSRYRYWYYFHSVEFDTNHQFVEEVDILDEILNIDYLMIIWCPINIYKLGHGFPEQALISLCVDDSVVAARFRQVADSIQYDPVQMEAIHSLMSQNGWRQNEAISKEVYKRFYANPAAYFYQMSGTTVPSFRNSRIAQSKANGFSSAIDRRRGEIRHQIQGDSRWTKYVKRQAEEELISHEEAFANEVEWVLAHPNMSDKEKAVKQKVIEIYSYEPWLAQVAENGKKNHQSLNQAVWCEARKQTK